MRRFALGLFLDRLGGWLLSVCLLLHLLTHILFQERLSTLRQPTKYDSDQLEALLYKRCSEIFVTPTVEGIEVSPPLESQGYRLRDMLWILGINFCVDGGIPLHCVPNCLISARMWGRSSSFSWYEK